jgi:hypothetical protein
MPNTLQAILQFLLEKFDAGDKGVITRRAVELQASRVSLFYPERFRLTASGKLRRPPIDMVWFAKKHAALALYKHYTARDSGLKGQSIGAIEKKLSANFGSIETVLDILKGLDGNLPAGGLPLIDFTPQEYSHELQRMFSISRSVAEVIDVYRSNGSDLPRADCDNQTSTSIVINAICDVGRFNKSEKTLSNYFRSLEPTAVFHYLYWLQGCKDVLVPAYPLSSEFAISILRKGGSTKFVDELRCVCKSVNIIAEEFNNDYKFNFPIIENVPDAETDTDYSAISPTEYDHNISSLISGRPTGPANGFEGRVGVSRK